MASAGDQQPERQTRPAAAECDPIQPGPAVWEQTDLLSLVATLEQAVPPEQPAPAAGLPDPRAPGEAAAGPPQEPTTPSDQPASTESDLLQSAQPQAAASPAPEPAPAPQAPAPVALPAPPAAEPVQLPSFVAGGGQPRCPQRLLILDTETTGLDPEHHSCIELGAVLFDVPHRAVLSQVSFLIPCQSNPAEAVNGIPAAVSRLPQPWRSGLVCFEAMLEAADVVLAHNAAFDRQWFGRGELPAIRKPWLCSMEDLRWPAERNLRATPSVRDLALAYGVPVWAAHRALTDCIYLAQVFERCADLEALLQAGLEPRQLYRARLSYEERHKAREAGFRWNEPVSGAWSRRLSEREAALLPFPVVPVPSDGAGLRRSA
ncbi:3'-5' exonuclease [Vulcanococcus limneticus Candia 3F8]|uniref:3'-5' exonuclease n=1 Tax=Vulcanococcus limneticus TaxID=2170428 RepID=UPI000B995CE2|nr:3'-5' exonuclease [Vulcanococcus limneticus MW73D5]MCP9893205.1 3'-5' exonuclease [Vulcanococcus limneticus Candia 3F8]MCP9897348.1 3'-5' exonuclease [Vulcanococcus limneticus Candia 3B3]